MTGVVLDLPSSALDASMGKVFRLSLLHLQFAYRVAGDSNLPPVWEAVAQGWGNTEELATLTQALMRGLTP